jgi:hypothetical protein
MWVAALSLRRNASKKIAMINAAINTALLEIFLIQIFILTNLVMLINNQLPKKN